MGLREEGRRRTRARIREAAHRLFLEHGFDETTVDMIAAAAEVSPRTFFRYFETKDGVLATLGFEVVDRVLERIEPEPSATRLIHELAAVFEAALEGEEEFRRGVALFRENPSLNVQAAFWRERWALQLAEGIASVAGRGVPNLRDRVVASAALHTVAACADEWLYRKPDTSFSDLADEAVRALEGTSPPSP